MKPGYPVAAALAGLLAAIVLTPIATHALIRRDMAETALFDLQQRVARAAAPRAPLVRSGAAWRAASRADASTRIAALVRHFAAGQGVLVETMDALPAPEGLARLHLSLSGSERAVLALSDTLERQQPLLRFQNWRVEAIAQGQVRLEAVMVAPWQK